MKRLTPLIAVLLLAACSPEAGEPVANRFDRMSAEIENKANALEAEVASRVGAAEARIQNEIDALANRPAPVEPAEANAAESNSAN